MARKVRPDRNDGRYRLWVAARHCQRRAARDGWTMTLSRAATHAANARGVTLGQFLDFVTNATWRDDDFLMWPPDVFAVSASLLRRTGAYLNTLRRWPPAMLGNDWPTTVADAGREWRSHATDASDTGLPLLVQDHWRTVQAAADEPLEGLESATRCCDALLTLTAIADTASEGAGIPIPEDDFENAAMDLLNATSSKGATLCRKIPRSGVRVLPKLHTPQTGLTIRSLSHNLAISAPSELNLHWQYQPLPPGKRALNLLLIPWPTRVTPRNFTSIDDESLRARLPHGYGVFTFRPPVLDRAVIERLPRIIRQGAAEVGDIDGVIFPELALDSTVLPEVREAVTGAGPFLIAGVAADPDAAGCGGNKVVFDFPLGQLRSSFFQSKHHRWRLDGMQVRQYSLGAALDPTTYWWEHIGCEERELWFFAMEPWLTLCALVCEDLARQEPVADAVRAVGPNLLIALLMDGPQLGGRWSARYATVFAEDPGTSVLTVTSLGMAERSRATDGTTGNRRIALWKDARLGRTEEIECPRGADGVVLSLTYDFVEEWTADGRSDKGTTAYILLSGVHPITLNT